MAEQQTNTSTSRLGRGLASLIGDVPRNVAPGESELELNIARLPIEKIQANKQNPCSAAPNIGTARAYHFNVLTAEPPITSTVGVGHHSVSHPFPILTL